MNINFKNEEEVKEYLQNTEIEFMYGCEKEFNSDSCARLANFLESIRKKFGEAGRVYKSCCDTYKNPMCCYKTGQYHMLGKGGLEKSKVSAFKAYRTGCIQPKTADEGKNDRIASSCCNMGLMMLHMKDEKDAFLKAASKKSDNSKADNKEIPDSEKPKSILEALKRSCDLKDGTGCNFLSQMYMQGLENECKVNWKMAAQYAEKSCDLGNPGGCHNISIMHRKGDGVPVDHKKAEQFEAKKKELIEGAVSLQFGA